MFTINCGSDLKFLTDMVEQTVQIQIILVLEELFDQGLHCLLFHLHLSLIMRKPAFCICENKDADQLRGNRKADQRLCFHLLDSTVPLLSKS